MTKDGVAKSGSKPAKPHPALPVEELVKNLLLYAADRTSSDLVERQNWSEWRGELKERDRAAAKRLDGCISKRPLEVEENPVGLIRFVLLGIEESANNSPGMFQEDGTIVDEILRDGHAQYVIWVKGEYHFSGAFERDGITYLPVSDQLLEKGKILLASSLEEYGDEAKLFADLVAFATKWVEVDATILKIVLLEKMTEWLYEKVPALPIINPRGGSDTGKTRLGNVLWVLSFRGMRADGVLSLSSLFRNAELWRGTLYINEGDVEEGRKSEDSEATQIVKFYNSRYERDAAVWRTDKETMKPEVFSSFGPTILITRKGFRDDALESRCLVVPMLGRTRTDIPLNLPPEFYEEAQHLRNRLELFRLKNLGRFNNDFSLEFEGVSTRMNQILQPMASLAKASLPELYAEIAGLARDLSEKVVEQRASSDDGLIVRTYLALDPGLEGVTSAKIAELMKELHGVEMRAEKVGRRATSLGFEKLRKGHEAARLLRLTPEMAARLMGKYVPDEEREDLRPEALRPARQSTLEGGSMPRPSALSAPSAESTTSPAVSVDADTADGADGVSIHPPSHTADSADRSPVREQKILPSKGQHPDRMFAFEFARDAARYRPDMPVFEARGDAKKAYMARFNKDPEDRDQFEAGIIGGLKAAKDARDAEAGGGSP